MYVAEIWRYPVKSLAGEMLQSTEITEAGIPFDRIIQIRRSSGKVVSARRFPRLLSMKARVVNGEVQVGSLSWNSPAVVDKVHNAVDNDVSLEMHEDPEQRFDILPLLVGTESAFSVLGYDRRRFRPNIVIGGTKGFDERSWPGKLLRIGDVVIDVAQLRARCVMTTYDPDTQEQDMNVLKTIVRELEGTLALDCSVAKGGVISVGQEVLLVDATGV